jgi:hypothetical protein
MMTENEYEEKKHYIIRSFNEIRKEFLTKYSDLLDLADDLIYETKHYKKFREAYKSFLDDIMNDSKCQNWKDAEQELKNTEAWILRDKLGEAKFSYCDVENWEKGEAKKKYMEEQRSLEGKTLIHDANDPNKLARGLEHPIAFLGNARMLTCYEGEEDNQPDIAMVEKHPTRAWQAYTDAHDLWMQNSNPQYGKATKTEGPEWDALQKAKEELVREMKGRE